MNKKNGVARLGMLVLPGIFSGAFAAETPADTEKAQPAASDAVDVEVFQAPQIRYGPSRNAYPSQEVLDGREGWVVLNMMIDPRGKPYEAMVVDSSGNPAFEKAALKALNEVSFEPARRGKTTIDASYTFKFKFAIDNLAKGANGSFVSTYKRFVKAIDGGDKAQADVQLALLKPQNLYEDAFANFGKFYYHRAWGTPAEQLADLRSAVAGEKQPTYLPKDAFVTALFAKFRLEAAASDFGSALDTWDILERLAPPQMRKDAGPVVDRIRAIQNGNQPVRQLAAVGNHNDWSGTLLRNRFGIAVKAGLVNEIKLRCAKKYLFFKYEPGVEYSIGSAKDRCDIEVVGDPGTTFEIVQ